MAKPKKCYMRRGDAITDGGPKARARRNARVTGTVHPSSVACFADGRTKTRGWTK